MGQIKVGQKTKLFVLLDNIFSGSTWLFSLVIFCEMCTNNVTMCFQTTILLYLYKNVCLRTNFKIRMNIFFVNMAE